MPEATDYEKSAILTAWMNRAFMAERALLEIRESAAMKPNGGAWAAGLANLCLATLPKTP